MLFLLDGLFNEDFFTVFLNTFFRLLGFSGCVAAITGGFTIFDGCEIVLRSFDRFWVCEKEKKNKRFQEARMDTLK